MALFMIQTEDVSSAASNIKSISNELSNLADTVSGMSTDAEDFDFSTPKSVIAGNIEACAKRVGNTSTYMEEVVNAHTSLQNSLQFKSSYEKAQEEAAKASNTSTQSPTSSSGTYNYPSSSSTGGYTAGAVGATTGGAVSAATTPVTTTESTDRTPVVTESTPIVEEPTTEVTETTPTPHVTIEPSPETPVEIPVEPDVSTTTIPEERKPEEGTPAYEVYELVDYDDDGYARVEDRYVISCSENVGKVGDEVVFTLEDGTKVRCVVGENRETNDNDIQIITNENYTPEGDNNRTPLLENVVKVENIGQGNLQIDSRVESAIDIAVKTTENGGFESEEGVSILVESFQKAGIPIDVTKETFDGDYKDLLMKSGFDFIEGKPNVEDLKPGDVIVTKNGNLLMYIDKDKTFVDYSTFELKTDANGKKVPVIDDGSFEAVGVLRYSRKNTIPTTETTSDQTPIHTSEEEPIRL